MNVLPLSGFSRQNFPPFFSPNQHLQRRLIKISIDVLGQLSRSVRVHQQSVRILHRISYFRARDDVLSGIPDPVSLQRATLDLPPYQPPLLPLTVGQCV